MIWIILMLASIVSYSTGEYSSTECSKCLHIGVKLKNMPAIYENMIGGILQRVLGNFSDPACLANTAVRQTCSTYSSGFVPKCQSTFVNVTAVGMKYAPALTDAGVEVVVVSRGCATISADEPDNCSKITEFEGAQENNQMLQSIKQMTAQYNNVTYRGEVCYKSQDGKENATTPTPPSTRDVTQTSAHDVISESSTYNDTPTQPRTTGVSLLTTTDGKVSDIECQECLHIGVKLSNMPFLYKNMISGILDKALGNFSDQTCLAGTSVPQTCAMSSSDSVQKCTSYIVKMTAVGMKRIPTLSDAGVEVVVVSRGCATIPEDEPDNCTKITELEDAQIAMLRTIKQLSTQYKNVSFTGNACYNSKDNKQTLNNSTEPSFHTNSTTHTHKTGDLNRTEASPTTESISSGGRNASNKSNGTNNASKTNNLSNVLLLLLFLIYVTK